MTLQKGSKVWVEDKCSAWIAAEVTELIGKQFQVLTENGKKVLALPENLLPRDVEEDYGGVDDMTKLTYLNEPGVLHNLHRRYVLNEIYTYTGSILIAVNPFTKLPHLYNMHMMEQYKGAPFGELSPHVFAVADASYRAMMSEGQSQSILVSGESGAGKTETTKLIMQYLTYVGGRAAINEQTVEQQVLESNPLLEAFGNARTVRNDNSSRFGKFVEIQFDASGRISGAAIRTYLLERSRVVQITESERNYHCFYQLCASGKDAEKYKLSHPSHFHYLNQSKTYDLDGVSNAEEYVKTRRAMDIVGISNEEQEAIFRTLAAILHLGNIEFSPGKEHDSSAINDQKSNFHLEMAANLLMCDLKLLVTSLCTRSIQTLEGIIIKALDCDAAAAGRDVLAKTIYAQLFDWLVEKINRSVGQDHKSRIKIGVLDIYGFECFVHNSFEQFCINFANEKLQQHFNEHVFKMEQEEYQKEEINWSYIEFIDNQDVLDLIEKKPLGIIALLDEACMFPKSTHQTFSNKLFQNFRGHTRLERVKFSETDFTLSHYAGKVTYKTETFLDKNRDYIVVEHRNLLYSSKCPFVAGLFPPLGEESSRSSYKFSSVASRFKQQLQALMETLSSTEPHYIRCVKPNSLNRAQKFEKKSILHQLRCGGVLEAVRISLAGYPTRRTYPEFVDRFGIIALEMLDGCSDERRITEKILRKLKLDNFQLGKTKVFLRAGQIAVLDSSRTGVLDSAAKCIQRRLRTYLACRDFVLYRATAIALQSFCRGFLARLLYTSLREASASLVIQKYVRRWILKHSYVKLYATTLVMQSSIRGFMCRRKFLHQKENKAASIVQANWRMCKVRSAFHNHRSNIIAIQCLWRQKLARRELRKLKQEANEAGALRLAKTKLEKQLEDVTLRFRLEKKSRISFEEAKVMEISKLKKTVESLSLELDAARLATVNEINKSAVIQRQLELSMKEKTALEREEAAITELKNENAFLKKSLAALEERNTTLERELVSAKEEASGTLTKLKDAEKACSLLQRNLKSLEGNLSSLEDENLVLHQKALSSRSNRAGFSKPFLDKLSGAVTLHSADRKSIYETPPPVKPITLFSEGFSDSRRGKVTNEKYEILSLCIKEKLGFQDGKPVAACLIFTCLLRWHAFESEKTPIFEFIVETINGVLQIDDDNNSNLPYWLSNTSALLCLLQRNLRANGFFSASSQRSGGGSALNGRFAHDGMAHMEARYPAILFKQQLTASVEKIFGLIRDNLKKEISRLLGLCIQGPKFQRVHGGKMSRSPGGVFPQAPNNPWDSITKFLDAFVRHLRDNLVPSFFIRKLTTLVFSFINFSLFNSLLLRRECCSFSNGEYVKSGLAELEKWIANAQEEFSGTSWHELKYIRQAVGFLVIHQKRKKSLEEIMQDLCPALTIRQIYRIITMYWDDKYGTQSVSNEAISQMREILNKDSQNLTTNSFLLDEDPSIPFSTEDIYMALPEIDPSLNELPKFLSEFPSVLLQLQQPK
ncbi:unnamed protein product [Cuscuta epithymum]|uniref:Myosin-15 n=1 Tax=Cuscuta epithymum TaxID=186058 RepID=A0AAV0GFE4_9ASTE|nr:unnamed protein product [Cuscuta epithymum]